MKVQTWKSDMLSASFKQCDAIMAERAKSFYQAFQLLPTDRFEGVTALYAFNRYVDDLVDNDEQTQSKEEIIEKLDRLKEALIDLYQPEKEVETEALFYFRDKNWWAAFEKTLYTYNIPLEPLILQIEGQTMDMNNFQIETVDDLILYSKHVAGSVGWMMSPLLVEDSKDLSSEALLKASLNLGIGMQITNILRDVGEDYRELKRIYLPSSLMNRYGITEEDIAKLAHHEGTAKEVEGAIPVAFKKLWEELATLADEYYKEINEVIHYFHPQAQFPVLAAAYSYHGIAQAVRNSRYNCFTVRNYTSSLERTKLIKQARKHLKNNK